jgi:hypothetical protein
LPWSKFRSVYGVAGARPEACGVFYKEDPERLNGELAGYLRRAHSAGTLKVPNPPLCLWRECLRL